MIEPSIKVAVDLRNEYALLYAQLLQKLGCGPTALVREMVREKADKEGIKIEENKNDDNKET